MKTVSSLLAEKAVPGGSLRILTGSTYSGKRAIFISGTSEGLRFLSDLLRAQAEAPDNDFCKMERSSGQLAFTTDDSVEIFELHTTARPPENHPPVLE